MRRFESLIFLATLVLSSYASPMVTLFPLTATPVPFTATRVSLTDALQNADGTTHR